MKTMEEYANQDMLKEDLDKQYDKAIQMLQEAKENQQPIDEGLFKAIFGGLVGATAGPALGKALCKALGLDERGMLGNLLTSRLFLTALGGYMGWKN